MCRPSAVMVAHPLRPRERGLRRRRREPPGMRSPGRELTALLVARTRHLVIAATGPVLAHLSVAKKELIPTPSIHGGAARRHRPGLLLTMLV